MEGPRIEAGPMRPHYTRTGLIFAGVVALSALSCQRPSISSPNQRVIVSTNFTGGSRFVVESIPFERLRRLPHMEAILEQKFAYDGPSTQVKPDNDGDAKLTNVVSHAVAVFRTPTNHRFAVHDENPSQRILTWHSRLEINRKYTFPDDAISVDGQRITENAIPALFVLQD